MAENNDFPYDGDTYESEAWTCWFCLNEVPDYDMTECEECGTDVCQDCIARCSCGELVCPDCLVENRWQAGGSVKGGDQ